MNDDLQRHIEELRAKISIVDVVSSKVKLTKKGREYQGLCPFHNEKTPSFTVNESKGFYHCFGCGAHGDIVRFETEANGLPFIDAVKKLSDQAGMSMPKFNTQSKEEAETSKSLYEVMELACSYFQKELESANGRQGFEYFHYKRELSQETIKKFRLGYAPNTNGLMSYLSTLNVSKEDMQSLGLITTPEDTKRRPHDFFRNRVMIPITNKQGKIIAFGGRVMEKIEPKYLNSPETPIFNKRRNLYNLDKAREVAYKEKKLIICEGYMDVIALDRYGFGYAVAPLGTALTEDQIAEAWKVCPEPILCLDGDNAGIKAALRTVDRVLPILKPGYSLQFMFLPDKMDPDDYLQAHGKDNFAALMNKTQPLMNILWNKYTEDKDVSTPEKKALIENTLISEVNKITDTTVRGYYLQEIKDRIYINYRQSAWKKEQIANNNKTNSEKNNNSSTGNVLLQMAKKNEYKNNWNKNKSRTIIAHGIDSAPNILCTKLDINENKNMRNIIANLLIYPELIDEYEEQITSNSLKDNNIKALYEDMLDTYHNSETKLNGEDLQNILKEKHSNCLSKTFWEFDMANSKNRFIKDIEKEINKILQIESLQKLEKEIEDLNIKLAQEFSEDLYYEIANLTNQRNEIIANAEKEEEQI